MPEAGRPANGILALNVLVLGPQPPILLTITANDQPLATTLLQSHRTVLLLVPDNVISNGDPRFGRLSPTWSTPNDVRQLGVGAVRVTWNELGWTLPPVKQLWAVPGLVLALGLLLIQLTCPSWIGGLGAGTLGVALALGAALPPLEVAPYTHRLLLIVLLLWTALTRPETRWWSLPRRAAGCIA